MDIPGNRLRNQRIDGRPLKRPVDVVRWLVASPKLRREVIDGATYWSGGSVTRALAPARAHLLSIYDEYISSYRDRSAICEPTYGKRLVGMGNALAYVVIVDGRITGTWKRSFPKRTVRVEVTPFRKLARAENHAVGAAAARFARFLGEDHVLDLKIA